MKKILAVSLLANAALLACFSWKELVVHAAGGGGVPLGNGDVNGDGAIDISDAVYLVNALFLGGPDLKAIECPPPAGKGLPATGQTKCYDQSGGIIECAGATCPGQDGAYVNGCPSEGRFADNGDGTVTDNCTGLMWQKDTADTNADGRLDGNDALPWCDGLAYCESLSFAGHDDWRPPNVRELQSIVDYGRIDPAIDPVFGAVSDYSYWSSSTSLGKPFFPWIVRFGAGYVTTNVDRASSLYVRAVRNAP